MPTASKHAPTILIALFALLAVTPVCGGFFACGCDWPWEGLFIHCASLRGIRPACPWCEQPLLGWASLALPVLGGLTLARLRLYRRRREHPPHPVPEFALAVAAGVLGVLASLVALGLLTPLIQHRLSL